MICARPFWVAPVTERAVPFLTSATVLESGAAGGADVKISGGDAFADDRRPPALRAGKVLHAGPAGGLPLTSCGLAAGSLAGHGDSRAVLENLDHAIRKAWTPTQVEGSGGDLDRAGSDLLGGRQVCSLAEVSAGDVRRRASRI